MPKKHKIRWGIAGTGGMARAMALTLRDFKKEVEIVAVLSRTCESGEKFASEFGIDLVFTSLEEFASCPDIDLVYVATPHNFHKRDSLASISQGKAVLVEKSMAINEHEVQTVVDAARSKGVFLMEAMWTQFFPAMQKALEIIDAGKIGKVRLIDVQFCIESKTTDEQRWFNKDLAGGALLDLGVYSIYLTQMVMNQYPKSITGEAYFGKTGVDEQNAIVMKYNEGQLAVLTHSLRTETRRHAIIYGTEGRIEIPFFNKPDKLVYYNQKGKKKKYNFNGSGLGYAYQVREVLNNLQKGLLENNIVSHNRSLEVVRIMDTIRKQWNLVYPSEHLL